jgi:NADPH-dependent 2,4-dienoyl-CoA reductase/sulfur reductase-like enzyme/ferredoxin
MRIDDHPILRPQRGKPLTIEFDGKPLPAYEGETISAALVACGIRTFGHHPKDRAPQGFFCANGQCAQCLVVANGRPVKACMTQVRHRMRIKPMEGLPVLPKSEAVPVLHAIETVSVPVLILGGGPAGMSAAVELSLHGVRSLLVDDKQRLGGKLVLQTHRFFGSTEAVYAGTRGIDIAQRLEREVRAGGGTEVWLESTALGVFSDRVVGVLRGGTRYVLVTPQVLLAATGAREKSLLFRGNTLPGVYGAGAFQTLVNRDLVKAAERLFIVGGGNVGLIAGYHALQAGIEVVGLVEALPECGGYRVHQDKLARLGVPIYTSHTILSANGRDDVESVTIARVDARFRTVPGTEQTFPCDTVLIAVGLDPVDEFTRKAEEFGLPVFAAGDAEEIAEASAAMFSGRIAGRRVACRLGATTESVPEAWGKTVAVLKARPGRTAEEKPPGVEEGVLPILHCVQEIPCNPCTSVCPQGLLQIEGEDIRSLPRFVGERAGKACLGCERCVVVCPGLAVTLVDYRRDRERPTVTLAFEFGARKVRPGERVTVTDRRGRKLGEAPVLGVRALPRNDRTVLVQVETPREVAQLVSGIRLQPAWADTPLPTPLESLTDDAIVCRCERVTAREIRDLIRKGYRDLNEIKGIARAGMGACGGKTCSALILRLFREEGVPDGEVTPNVPRPLFIEVPLGTFAGVEEATDA